MKIKFIKMFLPPVSLLSEKDKQQLIEELNKLKLYVGIFKGSINATSKIFK